MREKILPAKLNKVNTLKAADIISISIAPQGRRARSSVQAQGNANGTLDHNNSGGGNTSGN